MSLTHRMGLSIPRIRNRAGRRHALVASRSILARASRLVDGTPRPGQNERREPFVGSLPGNAQRLSDSSPGVTGLDRVSHHEDEPFVRLVSKIPNKPDMGCRIAQRGVARFSELLHGKCESSACVGNLLPRASLSEHVVKIP